MIGMSLYSNISINYTFSTGHINFGYDLTRCIYGLYAESENLLLGNICNFENASQIVNGVNCNVTNMNAVIADFGFDSVLQRYAFNSTDCTNIILYNLYIREDQNIDLSIGLYFNVTAV
jgi:hypothetical protein